MATWVSRREAAEIVGCTTYELEVHDDELVRRPRAGSRPILDRDSVEAWGARRRAARDAAARRQEQIVALKQPPEGHVWLDASTVALMIGCTPEHVHRLGRTEHLPCTRRGHRMWFRRDHVETYTAARAFAARQHAASGRVAESTRTVTSPVT